tara:strand:- start:645 stop:1082 length:438 start_codon:yes stop_codon:yes gene_type:complete
MAITPTFSEDEDDTESVNSNSTGDDYSDNIHMVNSIFARLNNIHDKCDKEKRIFLNAAYELLEHVEAISDGVPCDEQQYIDVANSLNVAVHAFSRSQTLYREMNKIVVEQRKENIELKRQLEARPRPLHMIMSLLKALKKKITSL